MCKKQTSKKWECLTAVEKQAKEKEKPTMDENADPSDGLMNMLKKIYAEGDDEMKRTINKAWSESQDKKLKGDNMMDFWAMQQDQTGAKQAESPLRRWIFQLKYE